MATLSEPSKLPGEDSRRFHYRPDIDGLRAVAVLAVVLYHAHLGIQGGYVGVDVFFVISGFLIGSIVRNDFQRGTFSLVDFWERRIRRIVPAVSVMVLLTVAIGYFVLFPSDFQKLGKTVIAQAVGVSNFYFLTVGDYFNGGLEENFLLHTWSLAVEEQFYVFLPVGLLLIYQLQRKRFTTLAQGMLVFGFLVSLLFAVTLIAMGKGLISTFYLLPGRAWELLGGVLIAFLPRSNLSDNRVVAEGAAWSGVTMIGCAMFFYTPETPFPGLAAVLPCLGAMLVILSNNFSANGYVTVVGRFLSLKGIVFIGLISYSLYLYHWPILVYAEYFGANLKVDHWKGILCLLIAFGISSLSWKFIETPFRRKKGQSRRAPVFLAGAGTIALMVAIGCVTLWPGFESAPYRGREVRKLEMAVQDTGFRETVTLDALKKDELPMLGRSDDGGRVDVLLWGDSHAMHAVQAIDELCKEANLTGRIITYSSTPPLLDFHYRGKFGLQDEGPLYSEAVLKWVEERRPRHVILAGKWGSYQRNRGEDFDRALNRTIAELHRLDCKVWVIMTMPLSSIHVGRRLLLCRLLGIDETLPRFSLAEHRERNKTLYQIAGKESKAVFIDPLPMLYSEETDSFLFSFEDEPVFTDSHHLSAKASRMLLLPFLRKKMEALR